MRLQKRFPAFLSSQVISYGSCQFPTLGFVVERYKAILNFVPEDFWKIQGKVCLNIVKLISFYLNFRFLPAVVSHTFDQKRVDFTWARGRLFNQLAVQSIFEKCEDTPQATVISVKSKPKSKWRPVAMDTVVSI